VKQILKGTGAASPSPAAPVVPDNPPAPPAPSVTELSPPVAPPAPKPGPAVPPEAKPVKDAAAAEAEAKKFYEELFVKEEKRVVATYDKKDDAAFGRQLLETAKTIRDQPTFQALLCEKAIELGAKHPEGYATVEEAAAFLIEKAPMKAAAQERLLAFYRQRFAAERDVHARVAAGEKFVEAALGFVEKRIRAEDLEACHGPLREAEAVARSIRSESLVTQVRDLSNDVRMKAQTIAQVKRLKAQVEKEPGNPAARKQLVEALVVTLDDPGQAAKYAEALEDAALKRKALAAAAGAEEATEAVAIELGDWYRDLATQAPAASKAALFSRALNFYSRFLQLHEIPDLTRTKVDVAIKAIETALDRLGAQDAAALALADQKTHDTQLAGGGSESCRSVSKPHAFLIGFAYTAAATPDAPGGCIQSIQPVFMTPMGEVRGDVLGLPKGDPKVIKAKRGYTVGGLVCRRGMLLDGFRPTFMRIRRERLDPRDAYEGEHAGGPGGGEVRLGFDGRPVVGVIGRTQAPVAGAKKGPLYAVGLVLLGESPAK
jgi:hypothetical protein